MRRRAIVALVPGVIALLFGGTPVLPAQAVARSTAVLPLLFRPSNGHWFVRFNYDGGRGQCGTDAPSAPSCNDDTDRSYRQFGGPGDQALYLQDVVTPGDHQGHETVVRWVQGQGLTWYSWRASTGVMKQQDVRLWTFGNQGDIAVGGDWTGTGSDGYGVFRPSTGTWYLCCSATGAVMTFHYGSPGDIPVVGDWNDDGIDTIGVFRPSQGRWFLTNHNDSGIAEGTFQYGEPGDVPVPADWNRDGTTTLGVFRRGTWYITNRFDGLVAEHSFTFGQPGDVPLTDRGVPPTSAG